LAPIHFHLGNYLHLYYILLDKKLFHTT